MIPEPKHRSLPFRLAFKRLPLRERQFLWVAGLLLTTYFILRAWFLAINLHDFLPLGAQEILKSFFFGIRFDITALVYTNALWIILWFLPIRPQGQARLGILKKWVFILPNFGAILVNLADASYFRFSGKRSTADFFSEEGPGADFIEMFGLYARDYWYVPALALIFTTALWFLYPKGGVERQEDRPIPGIARNLLIFFLAPGLLYLAARGTGLKPVRIITAASYVQPRAIPLCLNSSFTLVTTLGKPGLEPYRFFQPDELSQIYSPIHSTTTKIQETRRNVVVIILESFGSEYVGSSNDGRGYTPFLDSLISRSLFFNHAFANGKKSVEGIPAILAGIPALMDAPYISSPFAGNRLQTMASLLTARGYHCSFFHGGANGTMGFDQFCNLAGYRNYFGRKEYGDGDFDGNWGVYDEPFFQFFNQKLGTFPEPFLATIFSLSSHHPYSVPARYKGKFPKGTLPIHESVSYTDFALGAFFRAAACQTWYRNTIFILTADHTSLAEGTYYKGDLGKYAVPLLIYDPTGTIPPGLNTTTAQQIDIQPTILDLAGYDKPFFSFGRSLFDTLPGFAIQYAGGIYQYTSGDTTLQSDMGAKCLIFNNKKDPGLIKGVPMGSEATGRSSLKRLQAIVQAFNTRMAANQLTKE